MSNHSALFHSRVIIPQWNFLIRLLYLSPFDPLWGVIKQIRIRTKSDYTNYGAVTSSFTITDARPEVIGHGWRRQPIGTSAVRRNRSSYDRSILLLFLLLLLLILFKMLMLSRRTSAVVTSHPSGNGNETWARRTAFTFASDDVANVSRHCPSSCRCWWWCWPSTMLLMQWFYRVDFWGSAFKQCTSTGSAFKQCAFDAML